MYKLVDAHAHLEEIEDLGAALKGLEKETVAKQTTQNAANLFGIKV